MDKNHLFAALFTLCCLAGPGFSPAWGQIRVPGDDKWETSFFFGLSGAGDAGFVTPIEEGGTRDVGLNLDASYLLGVRVTENLGRYFGAELEYSFANRPLVFVDLLPDLPALGLDHKIHQLAYSVVVYAADRSRRLRPFGSIGFGTSLFRVSGSSKEEALEQGVELKDRWKPALSFGGGLKYRLGRHWGIRVDFRDQITGFSDFGLPSRASDTEPVQAGFRPDGVMHNWNISGGLAYFFGR